MKNFLVITLLFVLSLILLASSQDVGLLKEAQFYEKLEKGAVQCNLCPNYCRLSEGITGVCGVRQNIDGTLYTLVYNRPVSINIDPIEKKPLYHFYPGSNILSLATAGCNLRCNFLPELDDFSVKAR